MYIIHTTYMFIQYYTIHRSYLPTSAQEGPSSTFAADHSPLTPAVPPVYLPAEQQRSSYDVVEVERKVVVAPLPPPHKDEATVALEVVCKDE